MAEIYERELGDLPWSEYRTTVVTEFYGVRCPDCGIKAEKVPQLPSKAPFSKRFEEAVGLACERRRGDVWRDSLDCPAVRSEPSICAI